MRPRFRRRRRDAKLENGGKRRPDREAGCRSSLSPFDQLVQEKPTAADRGGDPEGFEPSGRRAGMRVMVMVKATEDSEAGVMPSEELLAAMMKFNEELVDAGVMLAGEGLHPSSKGARVVFSGKKRSVVDGPFAETKELVAGFWLWRVESMEEAIAWVKRCPNPMPGDSEIEIRPLFEADDFGAELTPELREQEERLRSRIEERTEGRER
jgi:hypothetical protein